MRPALGDELRQNTWEKEGRERWWREKEAAGFFSSRANFYWPLHLWGLCGSRSGSEGSSWSGFFLADTRRSVLAPVAIPACPSNSSPCKGTPKPGQSLPCPLTPGHSSPQDSSWEEQVWIFQVTFRLFNCFLKWPRGS